MGGDIAIVADRISWEERQLIHTAPEFGLRMEWVNDESLCLGHPDAELIKKYDAALIRSRSYTRGGLLATLTEASEMLTMNSASAIHACENKLSLRTLLRTAGVPVTDFRLVLSRRDFTEALDEMPLPVVFKPVLGGMGKRVTLVRHSDTAQSVYDYVEDLGHGFEQAGLVEPYLDEGTSVRCFVVGGELVATAEFAGAGKDWRSNAALGSRTRAFEHEPDVRDIVDRVVGVLGEGIYGIDLFHTPTGYVVNEVNHAPAFRAVSSATGLDFTHAINSYVQEKLR